MSFVEARERAVTEEEFALSVEEEVKRFFVDRFEAASSVEEKGEEREEELTRPASFVGGKAQ